MPGSFIFMAVGAAEADTTTAAMLMRRSMAVLGCFSPAAIIIIVTAPFVQGCPMIDLTGRRHVVVHARSPSEPSALSAPVKVPT